MLGAAVHENPKTRETTIAIHDLHKATVANLLAWGTPAGVIVELAGAAFSPDGTRFAASAVDSGIRVGSTDHPVKFEPFRPVVIAWDIESRKVLNATTGGSTMFGTLAYTPDGKSLEFGRRGMTIELEFDSQGTMLPRSGHSGEVVAVAFDRNNLLWSGGEDKFVRAVERKTGSERYVLRGCPQGVLRLAVSPDGKEVAAAAGDLAGGGVVLRFDLDRLARDIWRAPTDRDHPSLVTALTPDGSRFAACDFPLGDPARVRSVIRDRVAGTEVALQAPVLGLRTAFRPDGGLVVPQQDQRLNLVAPDGKPTGAIALPPHTARVAIALPVCSPDGRTIAVVGADQNMTVRNGVLARVDTWDAATRKPGKPLEADLSRIGGGELGRGSLVPTAAAFDRYGKRLAATYVAGWSPPGQARIEFRGVLVVWDLATGKELFRQTGDGGFHAVTFDPQGRVVVGGGTPSGGVVFGWDMTTGKKELALFGHTRPVLALAFGPDGRLATGGKDRVVKVWDLPSRREVLSLDGFAREVTHVAFTKDGRDLVAATGMDLMSTMTGGIPSEWPPAEVRTFRGPR